MNEHDILEHIQHTLCDTTCEKTAFGFILQDVSDLGFEGWLDMPPSLVADCFYEVTEDVSTSLVDDYSTLLSQEKEIESLGIEQSVRINHVECMRSLKDGILDVFKSMKTYYELQEFAKDNYEK